MKYKVITNNGWGFEEWEGNPHNTNFDARGHIVCESGVIIPWHEVRRLVPVVEPKAEASETAPRCNESYRLGNGSRVYCQLRKDHKVTPNPALASLEHFARHAGSDVMW